jgi:hypothetical protein
VAVRPHLLIRRDAVAFLDDKVIPKSAVWELAFRNRQPGETLSFALLPALKQPQTTLSARATRLAETSSPIAFAAMAKAVRHFATRMKVPGWFPVQVPGQLSRLGLCADSLRQ